MILTKEATSNKIIATIDGKSATETYECTISACPNPVCTCKDIDITFTPIRGDSEQIPQTSPKTVKIDLDKESLADHKIKDTSQETLDFAHDFIRQLQKDDFRLLYREHFIYKSHVTEAADLASIEANFPLEEIENESLLITYNDVLPYGKQLIVTPGNQEYLVLDHYCLKKNCSCTDTVLSFFALDEENRSETKEEVLTCFVNYRKRTWETEGAETCQIDKKAAIQALKAQYPKIYEVLQERHKQLKMLYANYRKRHGVSPQPASLKTTGRNDPCPCGSGKKYKKCCMRQKTKPDAYMWADDEGMPMVGKGPKLSKAQLAKMTNEYQKNVKNSPLWDTMIKEYGLEKAEEMLKKFQVEAE